MNAPSRPLNPVRDLLRQAAAEAAGPVIAFAAALARIGSGREIPDAIFVSALFAAVVAGAAFGGRWSALATVGLATIGLLVTLGNSLGPAAAAPVIVAVIVALVTGELRDRADRGEQDAALARARLRRLALRDPLTGLLDRRGFDFAIGVEMGREARRGGHFALLLFDLQELTSATERLGRSVADTILQVFGDSLEARIRQSDIPARIGEVEFAVILPDADRAGADVVAREVIKTFVENLRGIVPADLEVGARFGVARFPSEGRSSETLIGLATEDRKNPR